MRFCERNRQTQPTCKQCSNKMSNSVGSYTQISEKNSQFHYNIYFQQRCKPCQL